MAQPYVIFEIICVEHQCPDSILHIIAIVATMWIPNRKMKDRTFEIIREWEGTLHSTDQWPYPPGCQRWCVEPQCARARRRLRMNCASWGRHTCWTATSCSARQQSRSQIRSGSGCDFIQDCWIDLQSIENICGWGSRNHILNKVVIRKPNAQDRNCSPSVFLNY